MLKPDEFYKVVGKAMFCTPCRTRAVMMRCKRRGDTTRGFMHDIWCNVNKYRLRGYKPSTFIFNQVKWMLQDRRSCDAMQQGTHVEIDDVHSYQSQQEECVENKWRNDAIENSLRYLKKRERLVLKLRFGLYGDTEKTLGDIGRILGVSDTRVNQIESHAIRKLQSVRMRPILARYADR